MRSNRARFFVGGVLIVAFFCAPLVAYMQDASAIENRRAELQAELNELEKEIEAQRTVLDAKQRENTSLERDISILEAKIEKARLQIRARDLDIKKLSTEIYGKESTISDLNSELSREKASLAQLIRKTSELDDFTLVEIMLSEWNLSEFFADADDFDTIEQGLQESFEIIASTKNTAHEEKLSLEERRSEEEELRKLQELEERKIKVQEQEKQEILEESKGVERVYLQIVREKEKTAAEIRAELFTLRGTAAIPFEEALAFAQDAGKRTGVRPALILGVIAEESNLGENVGTGNWNDDMHPTRDKPVFEEITRELGLDPNQVPVSKKPWYGWGGAMGPAQFIPSTWILYKDRIAKVTGHNPPNPWDPGDAFVASALLLSDNGADRGTFGAERLAALRYFAGWKNAENPSYAFYGDEVMELTTFYQNQIDILARSQ